MRVRYGLARCNSVERQSKSIKIDLRSYFGQLPAWWGREHLHPRLGYEQCLLKLRRGFAVDGGGGPLHQASGQRDLIYKKSSGTSGKAVDGKCAALESVATR